MVGLIENQPDEHITRVIQGWPRALDASRALSLGFVADPSFESIIRLHIEHELDARIGARHAS